MQKTPEKLLCTILRQVLGEYQFKELLQKYIKTSEENRLSGRKAISGKGKIK